jgi:hypothetical protein
MRNGTPFSDTPHVCRYIERLVWTRWSRSGVLAERLARQIPFCQICGRERPALQPRQPVLREVRIQVPEAPPLADATGRAIAKALVRLGRGRVGFLPTGQFFIDLARAGIPVSVTMKWIDAFLRAGWLNIVWRPGNPPHLAAVALQRTAALRALSKSGGGETSPPSPSSS